MVTPGKCSGLVTHLGLGSRGLAGWPCGCARLSRSAGESMTTQGGMPSGDSDGGGPIRRTVRVINPRGLHPRIIDLFTKTAKQFTSTVTLTHNGGTADGKSVWDLIVLVVEPGGVVVLEVDGGDAAAAIEPLAQILAASGGEDYTI